MINQSGPQRIVCLTEETTETLYLLGEDERIVGVSGFTCRPKEARSKPKVSAFLSAKTDQILALKPDLVLGFSNLQAKIANDLIAAGLNVMVFNQRSVEEILATASKSSISWGYITRPRCFPHSGENHNRGGLL